MKKAKKHVGRGNKLRYPRIVWAAKQLGVTRTHLTAVLNGDRPGRPGLAADYAALRDNADKVNPAKAMAEAAGKLRERRVK